MTAKFFVDTNVLVYAASSAVAEQAHRDVALELLDRPDLALSAQVFVAELARVQTTLDAALNSGESSYNVVRNAGSTMPAMLENTESGLWQGSTTQKPRGRLGDSGNFRVGLTLIQQLKF